MSPVWFSSGVDVLEVLPRKFTRHVALGMQYSQIFLNITFFSSGEERLVLLDLLPEEEDLEAEGGGESCMRTRCRSISCRRVAGLLRSTRVAVGELRFSR